MPKASGDRSSGTLGRDIMPLLIANTFVALGILILFSIFGYIAPDPYFSLSRSPLLTDTIALALAVPFIILALVLWKKMTQVRNGFLSTACFVILTALASWQVFILWSDQFNASRGFGLIAVTTLYPSIFLPAFLITLFVFCLPQSKHKL